MNGFQNRKAQDLKKPFPGCVGSMMNIFDLSAGMTGTKMLTERAHRDEAKISTSSSPVRRNKPDVKKPASTSGAKVDHKQISRDLKQNSSSKKSGGAPVKMLIAQEMSKEMESKRKPPSVVARLMGLDDDLMAQPFPVVSQRKFLEGYPQAASEGAHRGCCQHDVFVNKAVPYQLYRRDHGKVEHRDVYEVWQQPSWSRRGIYEENQYELRMALVRQKFMEAKRLATDEKLLHSKEFQDALEILSSNRDLFLKFLEEPNSLFSKQIYDLPSIPPPRQTKRITVLKPSKKVETKSERMVQKQDYPEVDETGRETRNRHWNSKLSHLKTESFSQPTRIVVLKPSTGKPTKVRTPTMSPKHLVQSELYGDLGESEACGSGHFSKERAQQIQRSLIAHRRDESLLSSMYSNGYCGDGSSSNFSEINYSEEDGSGFSHSEIVTPTSRHSWDRFGSPYSASSFSRASYSPESSMIREAKKRLSERWALVASNGISQDQLHLPRSSSTLGEMLAIPEVKREACVNTFTVSSSRSCGVEDDLRLPASCLSVGSTKDSGEPSPGNLSRSKSVPVSSAAYEDIGLKLEGSDSQISKSTVSEVSKTKHGKLSFRGKVSSFFFSRSKKTNREIPVSSTLVGSGRADTVVSRTEETLKLAQSSLSVDSKVKDEEKSASTDSPISVTDVPEMVMPSPENPGTCDKSSGNLEQPSPTSILDTPFEDDINENLCQLSEASAGQQSLSRASPIESVARSLSWDDAHLEMSSLKPSNLYRALPKAEDSDQECFVFVQKLLSYAGLEKSDMTFSGWHSLDSPLDPMILEKLLDWKEEESKCIVKRSNMRLLFDCVNSALLEAGSTSLMSVYRWNRASCGAQINVHASPPLSEDVWGLIKDWFSGNRMLVFAEGDNCSLVVDRALRREVGGNRWAESIAIEAEEITKEISGEVLKDLVGEALADFTAACLC